MTLGTASEVPFVIIIKKQEYLTKQIQIMFNLFMLTGRIIEQNPYPCHPYTHTQYVFSLYIVKVTISYCTNFLLIYNYTRSLFSKPTINAHNTQTIPIKRFVIVCRTQTHMNNLPHIKF